MTRSHHALSALAAAALLAAAGAVGGSAPATAGERPTDGAHWVADAADSAPARIEAARRAGAPEYATVRLSGANRYATSVAATSALYPAEVLAANPLGPVFVASGTNFPDALAATAFARPFGPVLLVPSSGTVPSVVRAELRRLRPEVIVVVGGAGAVSEGVRAQLSTIAETDRVFGPDRYATAAAIARLTDEGYEVEDPEAPLGVETVYVVSGENFPDALAAGAATGFRRGAVVLSRAGSLPAVSAQAIRDVRPTRVVVVGGTATVSAAVQAQVRTLLPGAEVVRRSGADRFGTAAAVSAGEFVRPGAGVLLANGLTFPDSLTASGFGAVVEYPLLLVRATCAPAPTRREAASVAAASEPAVDVVGFGGTGVLSAAALDLTAC